MKKALMSILVMTAALTALAFDYDYPYLALQTTDGNEQLVAVESLEMTFADGKLVATNASGSTSIELTSLKGMYFTTKSTTSIASPATLADSPVEVSTASGVHMGRYAGIDEARRSLRPGVYILTAAGRSVKIVVR